MHTVECRRLLIKSERIFSGWVSANILRELPSIDPPSLAVVAGAPNVKSALITELSSGPK